MTYTPLYPNQRGITGYKLFRKLNMKIERAKSTIKSTVRTVNCAFGVAFILLDGV